MINVLLTGDYNVLRGIALNILSILKYTQEPVTFHIMTINVPWNKNLPIEENHIAKLKEVIKSKSKESDIIFYDISEEFIKEFESSPNKKPIYSPASLTRLFLTRYINVDKLIYLDSDTMAVSSLEAFNDIDISNYEMAVALDFVGHRRLNKDYFNSGVLYINMNKCKETELFEKAINLLKKRKFYFADQTALYKSKSNILYIPWRFNEQRSIKSDTVIKHFNKGFRGKTFITYNVKQWEVERVHSYLKIHDFDDIYKEYEELFKDFEPLIY